MITFKPDTTSYKSCNACSFHRHPNKDVRVFLVSFRINPNSNSVQLSLCEDCIMEFVAQAGAALMEALVLSRSVPDPAEPDPVEESEDECVECGASNGHLFATTALGETCWQCTACGHLTPTEWLEPNS